MRVLVCGGRDFHDIPKLHMVLDVLHREYSFDVVIEGDAPGADSHAENWAKKNKINNLKFPAEWDRYGKSAGPKRNQQMLDEGLPDCCIAFPTKNSKGTYDMIRRAKNHGIEVIVVEE